MRYGVLFLVLFVGCGPSPAMEPPRVVRVPADRVVEACPSADEDDDVEAPRASRARGVEYVRIDEWEPPPAVKEIEARIEPRGDKPPDYVSLPRLTMHREIAPMTTYRRGLVWH